MAKAKDLMIPKKILNNLIYGDDAFKYINDNYNLHTFPDRTKDPEGKAITAKFEEIHDLKLYHPNPMVVFRIGPNPDQNRMMCWLKALWVFFEYLKTEENYNIEWVNQNIPRVQPLRLKSIDIVATPKESEKKYRVSFYVTTGTIQTQGKLFKEFAEDHFPCIKYLFQQILENEPDLEPGATNDIENEGTDSNDNAMLQLKVQGLSDTIKDLRNELRETKAVFEDENIGMKKRIGQLEEKLKKLDIDDEESL